MSEQKKTTQKPSYGDLVLKVANKLAEEKGFIGLDEKVTVQYLIEDGNYVKGSKRKIGILKANVKQEQKIVKIIN